MIRPDEVRQPGALPERFGIDVATLEDEVDAAIRGADKSGMWPAAVPITRDNKCSEAVDHVRGMYRDAGWIMGNVNGCYFTVDRP